MVTRSHGSAQNVSIEMEDRAQKKEDTDACELRNKTGAGRAKRGMPGPHGKAFLEEAETH